MSTILTQEQLKQMVKNPHIDQWYAALEQLLDDYEINTPQRVAAFVAQCAHESGNFVFIKENLNYKAASLMKTFGKYFPTADIAAQYANTPERIANRVYASRMGNGDEASGDGYRYKGAGFIQLTGKSNYAAFDKFVDDDILANPNLVATKYPLLSAGWYWNSRALNVSSDKGASDDVVTEVTKKVNGGVNGLDDRLKHFKTF